MPLSTLDIFYESKKKKNPWPWSRPHTRSHRTRKRYRINRNLKNPKKPGSLISNHYLLFLRRNRTLTATHAVTGTPSPSSTHHRPPEGNPCSSRTKISSHGLLSGCHTRPLAGSRSSDRFPAPPPRRPRPPPPPMPPPGEQRRLQW